MNPPAAAERPLPSACAEIQQRCRWCDEGWELRDGEHWVVKGIGRITIKPCKRVITAFNEPFEPRTPDGKLINPL